MATEPQTDSGPDWQRERQVHTDWPNRETLILLINGRESFSQPSLLREVSRTNEVVLICIHSVRSDLFPNETSENIIQLYCFWQVPREVASLTLYDLRVLGSKPSLVLLFVWAT